MLVLQIQHFGLYPHVNRGNFADYIAANNRAAIFPAIIAALTLTVLSVALLFRRPAFFSFAEAAVCFILNLVNLVSTMVWQGRMHEQLAHAGYDDRLVKRLIQTNWVRTAALLLQSFVVFATLIALKI